MSVTLDVPAQILRLTAEEWDQAADRLDGAWRRLARTGTTSLSAPVAAAVETFRETWVEETKAMAQAAAENSDALTALDDGFTFTDRRQAEHIRSLLVWDYHDAPIDGAP